MTERDCWNTAMVDLNRGLNKGVAWEEAIGAMIEYYEKKRKEIGATAGDLSIFDTMLEIFKSKL
jgi:hypothetical protein